MTTLDQRGFTLVEMAIVLVVIGLIILTVFPALNAMRVNQQRSATQSNLQSLMRATAAYVQSHGCLPCPTPAGAIGNGFGWVGGAVNGTCGTCAASDGVAPYISLGIPAGVARDGWGHWITMRVDPNLAVLQTGTYVCAKGTTCSTFVPPQAPCLSPLDVTNNVCTTAQAGLSVKGMCMAGLTKNPVQVYSCGNTQAQTAAVLFVSHGASGAGSYVAGAVQNPSGTNGQRLSFATQPPACAIANACNGSSNMAAGCNASNSNQFVDAIPGSLYDDMMVYADRNTLVSMLGSGSCQTAW